MTNKYFSHTYLINLDERYDRLARVTSNCSMVGIDFERVPAIHFSTIEDFKENENLPEDIKKHWTKGAVALIRTTIKIIEDAKAKGYKSVLILEDDVEFDEEFNTILNNNLKHIPQDWEMIVFGGLHMKPYEHITDRLVKTEGIECLHAYAIHENIYDTFLDLIKSEEKPLDHYSSQYIHPRGKSYCFIPSIVSQYPSFSNIVEKVVNYDGIKADINSIDTRIKYMNAL